MRFFISFVIIVWVNFLCAHDFNFGRFHLYADESNGYISIWLDKENLLQAIETYCQDYHEVGICIQNYLRTHFGIEINDERIAFFHSTHQVEETMIQVRLVLEHNLKNVWQVVIYNNVLVEIKPDQENIVNLEINERLRTFRMHKDRVRIQAEY